MSVPERRHLFDDPRNVRLVVRLLLACCALLLLLDLVVHRHPSFAGGELPLETWFGFFAFYGFVACVLLVLAAKQMRRVLQRPEDYYGPPQPAGDIASDAEPSAATRAVDAGKGSAKKAADGVGGKPGKGSRKRGRRA